MVSIIKLSLFLSKQTQYSKACLLLVLGVVVTTCHLGGDSGDKRRVDTRHQRAEMVMVKGYWRSKPGSS